MNYDRLREAVKMCRACPLGARGNGVAGEIVGESFLDARAVMVIGEAPGGSEQESANHQEYGRPFIGSAGDLLRAFLEDCGLVNFYLTNIAKHRPWVVQGKQQPPDATAIKACASFLEYEFALVKPRKVILLGKPAAKTVLQLPGNPSAGSLVNRMFDVPGMEGVTALVLYHPSFFLHNRTAPFVNRMINDWKRALRNFIQPPAPSYAIEKVPCEAHG